MKIAASVATLILVAHAASGPSTTSLREGSNPIIRSISTL